MAKLTKAQKADQAEAIAKLQEILKPGDTISCILRHCSRSGMSRVISFLTSEGRNLDGLIARALDYKMKGAGLRVDGCGMDMGFSVVYNLSATVFPTGFGCIGDERTGARWYCPASDHSNGDRDYTPHGLFDENGRQENREPYPGEVMDGCRAHWHSSSGYALRYRWL